jgi:hypothetical protein
LGEITSKIYQGVVTSADDIYLVNVLESEGDHVVIENGYGDQSEIESELIRPFLKGQDVKRYSPLNPPQKIILPYDLSEDEPRFVREKELSEEYPKAHSYFESYESELRARDGGSMDTPRWYDLTRNQNMLEFEKAKIVTPEISYGNNFAYDSERMFHKSKVYGIITEDEWKDLTKPLLAVLNSKLLWFFLRNTGYVLRGGYFTFKTEYLNPFSVPEYARFGVRSEERSFSDRLSDAVQTEIESKSELDSLNLSLLDYLKPYADGPQLTEIGTYQPPKGVGSLS